MKKIAEMGKIRGLRSIIAAAAAGILLLTFGSVKTGQTNVKGKEDEKKYYEAEFYTEYLEKRIENLCREVHGIHEAHVLLTLEGDGENIYAENKKDTARDYVILQGDGEETGILVQTVTPRIRGVAVVCTRGDDSTVRLTGTELLSAALGIPASDIRVAGT